MGREGSGVRQVTEKSFQIEFIYKGVRCRERIKFNPATTPADVAKKQIERHREAILHAIAEGTFDYATTFPGSKHLKQFQTTQDKTIKEWLTDWLDHKEAELKSSTYHVYSEKVHRLIGVFGHIKLVDFKKDHMREWCKTLPIKVVSITNLVSIMRTALQDAYEKDLVPINVLANFKFKRNEPPADSTIDPFNREEQEAILSVMDAPLRLFYTVAFWTGMRPSEMCALEWKDIDFVKGVIKVRKAKTQRATKAETPKSRAGNREIKILPKVALALTEQKALTGDRGYVFINPHTDKPWRGEAALRKTWTVHLGKCGVRYRKPYQTRHTFASMMLSAGEELAWVSRQLGHSNVVITATRYATYIPDSRPDAGNKAAELFN